MKKNLLFLLGVILSLSLCLNCSSDNDGGKNPLEENYFTIESAVFHDGDLPTGNDELIYDLHINSTVITGGSTLISFSSTEPLSKAFVGVEGMRGYYEYDLKETKSAAEYDYEIILLISQNVRKEDFAITLSVQTVDGKVSQDESGEVDVIVAGSGDLQISLSWDQEDDLDLHVIDPLGNEIYYGDPYAFKGDVDFDEDEAEFNFAVYMIKKHTNRNVNNLGDVNNPNWDLIEEYLEEVIDKIGEKAFIDEMYSYMSKNYNLHGFLDIDSNAGCDIDGIKNENIYFEDPVSGKYEVYVNLYQKCKSYTEGAKYFITVHYKGNVVKISENQRGQFERTNQGHYEAKKHWVYIGTYTVQNSRSSSAPVAKQSGEKEVSRLKQRLFAK